MNNIRALELVNDKLKIIDQTKLPLQENFIITDSFERIAEAIERLEIRGAPAIGIAAAYALAFSFKNTKSNQQEIFEKAFVRLHSTRPTAVNLFYALDFIKKIYEKNINEKKLYSLLLDGAIQLHNDDILKCENIAKNGLEIFKKRSRVLTHCNTGALATGGDGTALNVIKYAYQNGMIEFVHVDETRPLLQGSRLTAWELKKAGIPFSINVDSAAAVLFSEGKVDLVITGADRVARNGDAANKIGTLNLALLCKQYGIPFYIAAPTTTIDCNCSSGEHIKIEMRGKSEIFSFGSTQITSYDYDTFSPAFDVTPNFLITAIVTDIQIHKPPYNFQNV